MVDVKRQELQEKQKNKYNNRKRERDPEEEAATAANGEGKEEKKEVIVLKDPLKVFGRDIMSMILDNLDARSGVLSLLVSHAWHGVASSDRLWSSKARIMKDDLCDRVWDFHFNKAAPTYWQNLDPYWKGTGPPMRLYFHPDGSLTADDGDQAWGVLE